MAHVAGTPTVGEDDRYATDDDLFDYEAGLDEALRGLANQSNNQAATNDTSTDPSAAALGLETEVKVQKKRTPIAKLDESRLLSPNGIPRLRRKAKTELKLRGKGHEFLDAAQLLKFYQLWLDDLYPRAKFTDGLTIIQKLGHTKKMQIMRKAWIDEGKTDRFNRSADSRRRGTVDKVRYSSFNVEQAINEANQPSAKVATSNSKAAESNMDKQNYNDGNDVFSSLQKHQHKNYANVPDDDELEALLAGCNNENNNTPQTAATFTKKKLSASGELLDEPDFVEDIS